MSQTVHFQGNAVPVAGQFPQAGDKAKAFTLVAKNLVNVALSEYAGKRKILNIFPSSTLCNLSSTSIIITHGFVM